MKRQSRAVKRSFSVKAINENSGFEISDKNTSNRLLQSLNNMRCHEILCDVKLKAQGGTISAHKNVLAAGCEYFNAMFSHQMAESSATEVTLEGVDVTMLRHLVNFMYTGVLQVEKNEVPELAMLTDMLQLTELKDRCVQLMTEEIDINNCIGMFEFAKKFNCDVLKKKAASIIQHRFPAVCKSGDLISLPAELFGEIISWDNLVLGNGGEDLVIDTALNWLEHDAEDRCGAFIVEILPHVILTKATKEAVQRLLTFPGGSQREDWSEVIQLQLEHSEEKKRIATYRVCVGGGFPQSRTGPNCPRLDTVECLNITEVELNDIENKSAAAATEPGIMNSEDNMRLYMPQWSFLKPLPLLPSFVKAFNIEGNLVCVACKSKEASFEVATGPPECVVLEYSLAREAWEHVSVPEELLGIFSKCFTQMGAMTYCNHRRKLYVMTNSFLVCVDVEVDNEDISMDRYEHLQNNLKGLRALEMRNTTQQNGEENQEQWERSEDDVDGDEDFGDAVNNDFESNLMLCHFGLLTLHGKLYVIGGADVKSQTEHAPRASVFMFDIDTKTWHQKADMTQSRACLTTVVLGNEVYAIGGYNRFRLRTAEKYDCVNDKWQRIADMEKFRSHTSSVAVGNKIMVLGGKSYAYGCGGARKVLNVVEVYSPENDTWTTFTPMHSARCMAMAATF